MALQIPAGDEFRVWEKSVDAGLRLGWIEHENRFAVFLLNRVVAGNGYLAISGIRGKARAKYSIVGSIGNQGDCSRC